MNASVREDLNYHHLRYFWVVACEGSIAKACGVLHVSQPTISGQLRELEKTVGEPLFERAGRNLRLTQTGRLVKGYCDELFAIGRELGEALAGDRQHRTERITVGISDSLPKLVAYHLLAPALTIAEPVRLECVEGSP
jgi:LysR family transcriptional activator of nhaA